MWQSFRRGERQQLAPTAHRHVIAQAIDGNHDVFARYSFQEGLKKLEVNALCGEGLAAHDHLVRTVTQYFDRPFRAANAPAHAAALAPAQFAHNVSLGLATHGGIEIDDLDFLKAGEFGKHGQRVRQFQRFSPALDKLDHFATHEINAGNNH